jgi:hypothetical protein
LSYRTESRRSAPYHGAVSTGLIEGIRALGRWMHPASPFAPRSREETALFTRVGVVSAIAVTTGLGLTAIGTILLALGIPLRQPGDPIDDPRAVIIGAVLILFSVLAPQASFRTRQAAWTRMIFSDTTSRVPTWQRSTVQFDALLVGAILAGLYFPVAVTVTAFGWALVAKVIVIIRRASGYDPNARFHAVMGSWIAGMTALVGYIVIALLAAPFAIDPSPVPMAVAVLAAIYAGLGFQALQRWGTLDSQRWVFVRDALDLQRLLVAAVIVAVAWLTASAGEWSARLVPHTDDVVGSAVGIAVLGLSWLTLWFAAVIAWKRDARRVLSAWRRQQAEVLRRIAEGSLNPDLAARAALPTATRVAVAIFGGAQARASMVLPDGTRRTSTASAALHPHGLPAELLDIEAAPHRRLPIGSLDGMGVAGTVVVADWLTAGGFVLRSPAIVAAYSELTSLAVLGPVVSQDYLSPRRAFDSMFHRGQHWPTIAALDEAVGSLSRQADLAPQSTSLIIGVLEIDDFGALTGGKFEQAAVAQVIRLTVGSDEFTGQELFVAYEEPGRIWIAILGGPIIRNGIGQLRALQEQINDHGSVTSRRVDIDVEVSVSLGYSTYQVDAVDTLDLRSVALSRLDSDRRQRGAMFTDLLAPLTPLDFTPEDITGALTAPTTTDLLAQLRSRDSEAPFDEDLASVHPPGDPSPVALVVRLGWPHAPGDIDLAEPRRFLDLADRQVDIAVEHVTATAAALKRVMAATGDHPLPVLAFAPSILLHPESGASALPNLAARLFDRVEAARTVFVFTTLPPGGGQAASLLIDRGFRIALSADAAADVDPDDLLGWPRWGVVMPVVNGGPSALDGLSVQQVTSALSSHDTRVIAEIATRSDERRLSAQGIELITPMWTPGDPADDEVDLVSRVNQPPR